MEFMRREEIIKLFPKIESMGHIYLDSSATTLKPIQVLKSMEDCYLNCYSSIKRSSIYDSDQYEICKENLKKYMSADDNYDVIFTTGATESLNLIAQSYVKDRISENNKIAVSILEHHSNYLPWKQICNENNIDLHTIYLDEEGNIDFNSINKNDFDKIKFFAITHVSNVIGNEQNLSEQIKYLHEYNKIIILDASQSVAHVNINLNNLDADFIVFSAHKMLGPYSMGAIIVKKKYLSDMKPWKLGGGMVLQAENQIWKDGTEKFESGTIDLPSIVGWNEAINIINNIGINNIHSYVNKLTEELYVRLKSLNKVHILDYINIDNNIGIISFTINGIHSHDVLEFLARKNIIVRVGHQCAQPLMKYLGITSCIRVSLYFYNTVKDIDALVQALELLLDYL